MKKLVLVLVFFTLFIGISFGQFTKFGGALSYNTGYYFNLTPGEEGQLDHKTNNPVISVTGIYEITLPLHLKPSLNVFMPRVTKTEFDGQVDKQIISAFSFDLDAHYVFNYLDRFELYGLAGLNFLFVKNKWVSEYWDESDASTNTALGLNLGIGSYMKLKEQFDLFGEVKYILAKQGQLVATVGILINLDWLAKNQNNEL